MNTRGGVDRALAAPEDGVRGSVAHEGRSAVGSTTMHDQCGLWCVEPEVVAEPLGGPRVYVGTRWSRAPPLERLVRLLRLASSGLRGGGIFSDSGGWCGTVARCRCAAAEVSLMASAIRLGHRTSSLVLEVAHNAWEVPAYAFSCG